MSQCLTPGATYTLTVRGRRIIHEITVPPGVTIPRDKRPLQAALHDAAEKALSDLFFPYRIKLERPDS